MTSRFKQLQDALSERILIIDGAMGTMIQAYKFEEEDFRGEVFKDKNNEIKECIVKKYMPNSIWSIIAKKDIKNKNVLC